MAKLDLRLNTPTKKSELTKENMLDFMKDEPKKDKEWFYKTMKSNTKKKKNNLTGEIIEGYDITKIRTLFAEKYFPDLNKKKPSNKPSFEDELEKLLD